jgi:tRNA(Ile)-lysidine synthase
MASSRKSSKSRPRAGNLAGRVAAQLRDIVRPHDRLVAGLSGGADSVVLLDCLQQSARQWPFRLSALHVNHQLSPNAARWTAFCRRFCHARGIPFASVKVRVRRGDGVEAEARAARYAAFARQNCDYVVLAHHRDDQVETFLLQLLRGAGVKGLAAMPLLRKSDGGHRARDASLVTRHSSPGILRPLLDATRGEILEYARERRLKWIEDESNAHRYFMRNYLRHEVLPLVARRFPSYRATIARSARHVAEANEVLDEVAAEDGAGSLAGGTLAVEGLRRLPASRARNLLRYFLAGQGVTMPATGRLEEALRQALTAKQDARVRVELDGASLRRYEGRVHVVRAGKMPRQFARRWRGEKLLELNELGGVLTLARTIGTGISLARLGGQPVTVRLRQGGERLQPDSRRPRRSLKNLLQEAKVPPWQRESLPLIFHGRALIWVPGIGVDRAYRAKRKEPALLPDWAPSVRLS